MITDNPVFWDEKAKQQNWIEYILPGKTAKEFHDSGIVQAKLITPFGNKRKTVLEYGCGIGRILKHVAPVFKTAYGVDICNEFLIKAVSFCHGVKNITFINPDFLNDRKEIADVVYSIMVMQHNSSQKREKIIEHILQLLKPGGIAIIQFPDSESKIYSETKFVHKFTIAEVEKLAALFSSFVIEPANLATYHNPDVDYSEYNEHILIATK